MRLSIDKKTGEKSWHHDIVYVDGKEELEIIRSWTIGEIGNDGRYVGMHVIFECPNGSFVYASGKPVENRKDLEGLSAKHRERAYKWFDDKGKSEEDKPKRGRPPKGESRDDLMQRIEELEKNLKTIQETGTTVPKGNISESGTPEDGS